MVHYGKQLALAILFSAAAWGQGGTATRIRTGAALPANCASGDIFYKTVAPIGTYECSVPGSPGAWRPLYNAGYLQLQTNGVDNGSQTKLNLVAGTNVTLTDSGTGDVTIDATGGGGGTVTTTGSPVSGDVAAFSGATSITSAASSNIVNLFTGCSGTDYLGADGACHTASGTGTVTNVATSSPLSGGPITTTGTISCPTCAIGPGSSTANHLATFSGTDGITLADGGAIPTGTVTTTGSPTSGTITAFSGSTSVTNATAAEVVSLFSTCSGTQYLGADGACHNAGGSGTVTSVDMSVPTGFTITGNPVTTSGTLAVGLSTESANTVWAGPTTGAAAAPTFRSLVAADIPSLSYVPTSRTITTTAPLTIDGGASADLSANRTIAVSDATSSTKGVVQPDNTTITISSGVISAVAGATPALVLITETVLTGTATAFTFSSIPGTYRDLIVRCNGRGDNASNTISVLVTLNGDSGSNYDRENLQGASSTAAASAAAATTSLWGTSQVTFPAASASANYPGYVQMTFPDYAETTFYKFAFSESGFITGTIGTTTMAVKVLSAWWRNTAAITSITVTASAGNFVAGSRCSLYGSY